jgi:hypothetical protein
MPCFAVFAGENAGARGTANLARRLTTDQLHADGGDAENQHVARLISITDLLVTNVQLPEPSVCAKHSTHIWNPFEG